MGCCLRPSVLDDEPGNTGSSFPAAGGAAVGEQVQLLPSSPEVKAASRVAAPEAPRSPVGNGNDRSIRPGARSKPPKKNSILPLPPPAVNAPMPILPVGPLAATNNFTLPSAPQPSETQRNLPLRDWTGEELLKLKFVRYNEETLSQLLPSFSTQPVAFLALETVEEQMRDDLPNQPSASGRDATGSFVAAGGKHRNKLVPLFVNSVCSMFFNINGARDYAVVIRKLLKRDPLLTFAIQKSLRYLKSGEPTATSHVTPDPSGQTSSLYGMRITPCVWDDGGHLQPALLVEHNVPYNPGEVMPRLMRDYAVLSHVPAILTLIDFQGKVLYQNASSLAYMGDLLSAKYDNKLSEGLLRVLFMYDLHNLEQMLEEVLEGREWQGVVQIPTSLRRYLAANHVSEGHESRTSFNGNSFKQRHAADAGSNGDLEVEFQIGNSFTTRSLAEKHKKQPQNSAFLVNRAQPAVMARNMSMRDARFTGNTLTAATSIQQHHPHLPGSQVSRASFNGAGHANHSPEGSFSHDFFAEQQSTAGNDQPQRKFMTLLDRAGHSNRAGRETQPNNGSVSISIPLSGHVGDGQLAPAGHEAQDDDDEDSYDEAQECYHEIHAIPLIDPVLDKQVIMLVQTDVTPRVELENKLADLTDAQLSMLEQLFPRHIIEYMLARVPSRGARNFRDLANTHEQVMVLFCDVVGFTSMSKEVEPSQVMHFLNELYEVFDELVDEYDMYKLDIVGDCYIVVAGLIKEDQDGFVCVDEMDEDQMIQNAVRIMQFAKAMLRESRPVLMPHNSEPVSLRIGIHTGPLVSGLVGAKMPKFTLFGDTMNTASRMESTCRPGCVHVSEAFAHLLPHEDWQSTGGTQVKGKGLMETFIWAPSSKKPELLDLEPEANPVRDLRRSLSMNSFTSMRSRVTVRSTSSRSGHRHAALGDSDSEDRPVANPLLTILHNIRGTEEEEAGPSGGPPETRSLARPVSARWPKSMPRASTVGHTSMDDDSPRGTGGAREMYSGKRGSDVGQRLESRPSANMRDKRRASEVGSARRSGPHGGDAHAGPYHRAVNNSRDFSTALSRSMDDRAAGAPVKRRSDGVPALQLGSSKGSIRRHHLSNSGSSGLQDLHRRSGGGGTVQAGDATGLIQPGQSRSADPSVHRSAHRRSSAGLSSNGPNSNVGKRSSWAPDLEEGDAEGDDFGIHDSWEPELPQQQQQPPGAPASAPDPAHDFLVL